MKFSESTECWRRRRTKWLTSDSVADRGSKNCGFFAINDSADYLKKLLINFHEIIWVN